METCTSICKIGSQGKFTVWCSSNQVCYNNVEGWGEVGGGRGVQNKGSICIPTTDSCGCMAETNTTLWSNYLSIKNKLKKNAATKLVLQPTHGLGSPFEKFQLDSLEAPSPGGDSKGEEATQSHLYPLKLLHFPAHGIGHTLLPNCPHVSMKTVSLATLTNQP